MYSKMTWNNNMWFTGELDGYKIDIDASKDFKGQNKGPTPKGLLLIALMGCTGIDVISLLEKMNVKIDSFYMDTQTDLTETHPKVFKDITLTYYFSGNLDNNINDIKKAINLSQEKYCGVSAMLKKNSNIIVKIMINGKEII
jgi:putative redox protein